MPAIEITDTKGLVQKTGTGVSSSSTVTLTGALKSEGGLAPANSSGAICNALSVTTDGFGIYEVLFEVDFGGTTSTATEDGLVKTAITIPANSMILSATAIVTEVAGRNVTNTLDLVSSVTANCDTSDEDTSPVLTIIDGLDFKSSTAGALGAVKGGVYANDTVHNIGSTGTSQHLVWVNKGTGNGTATRISGKILTYIKYMGSGPSVADTRV